MTKAEEAGRTTDQFETWRQLYGANERAWSSAPERAKRSNWWVATAAYKGCCGKSVWMRTSPGWRARPALPETWTSCACSRSDARKSALKSALSASITPTSVRSG